MKKLLYLLPSSWNYDGCGAMIDDILKHSLDASNEIFVIVCGRCVNYCYQNLYGNKLECAICTSRQLIDLRFITGKKNIRILRLSSWKQKVKEQTIHFHFSGVDELKNLKFHGVQIGRAALSCYVSRTRNINPLFSRDFVALINKLLLAQTQTIFCLEAMIKELSPTIVYVHNFRFVESRPLYELALNNHIDFVCCEQALNYKGEEVKDFYFNSTPHGILHQTKKIKEMWENSDVAVRVNGGKMFFNNRKNAKKAGDKVYVVNQIVNLLPKEFDYSKYNIAIFNSSEDEYCSVSEDYESYSLFSSQFEGIKFIFEHYKNDKTKHFYLRVHPNLKNVNFKYHTELYTSFNGYDNVSIIRADSPISSYSLLDHSNLVIVFGSTIGAEASYWNKPVINLAGAFYSCLDITYAPKSIKELFDMINDMNLAPIRNENVLKFGYYYYNDYREKAKYYDFRPYHLFNRDVYSCRQSKFFNSRMLYAFCYMCLHKICTTINVFLRCRSVEI